MDEDDKWETRELLLAHIETMLEVFDYYCKVGSSTVRNHPHFSHHILATFYPLSTNVCPFLWLLFEYLWSECDFRLDLAQTSEGSTESHSFDLFASIKPSAIKYAGLTAKAKEECLLRSIRIENPSISHCVYGSIF